MNNSNNNSNKKVNFFIKKKLFKLYQFYFYSKSKINFIKYRKNLIL